ncbi:hypothetical protein BGZ93_002082 [Podila epicladia]|nr:hypothetical protein BGZ93_002082 [Podila epicladia]
MIRKTIRDIPQKAMLTQPVPLGTRAEILERVQSYLGQQHSAEIVRSAASEQEGAAVGSVEAVEVAVVGKGTQDEDAGKHCFTTTSIMTYDTDSDDGEEEKDELDKDD